VAVPPSQLAVSSHRNTGSIRMARRAGIQQAASLTTSSVPGTKTNVSGSRGLTPNSRPARQSIALGVDLDCRNLT
jgi:hypothetical protein